MNDNIKLNSQVNEVPVCSSYSPRATVKIQILSLVRFNDSEEREHKKGLCSTSNCKPSGILILLQDIKFIQTENYGLKI